LTRIEEFGVPPEAKGFVTGGQAGPLGVYRSSIIVSHLEFASYLFFVPKPGLDFLWRIDGRTFDLHYDFPPSVAGLPPGMPMRTNRSGPCPPLYNIQVSTSYLEDLAEGIFDTRRLGLVTRVLPMRDGLQSDLARFHDEVQKNTPESRALLECLTPLVVLGLLRSSLPHLEPTRFLGCRHPGVSRSLRLIRRSYRENLTVADLAQEARLSPSQFLAAFRRDTGFTPHEFLCHVRIEAAKSLLAEGSFVTDAGFAVGFGSLGGFEEAFSRRVGVPPRAYRAARRA